MRKPSKRGEPRVEFLGEQDGPPERQLKAALSLQFRKFPTVERAYLARVGFGRGEPPSVALCLAPKSGNDASIVPHLANVFASLFSTEAHLDVMFASAEQEIDLRRVCRPFYDSGVARVDG